MNKKYGNTPAVLLLAEPIGNPTNTRTRNQNQKDKLSEHQIRQLMDQGYTRGLAESMNRMRQEFGQRIWIVDNSTSMSAKDGHRILPTYKKGDVRMVPCTRWQEIQECVNYHIDLAGAIQAPTNFRLLNNPGRSIGRQHFAVAETPFNISNDIAEAQAIMLGSEPRGCTPLTSHIRQIREDVKALAPTLQKNGQRIVIVVATDGLPTDRNGRSGESRRQEFVEALRQLEGLPVWVVIRLCTDEERVVNFYNELDGVLELSVEVLDDFCGEAQEVYECNPWLNYALPIHRMREFGYHDRIFDMLDERLLTKTELRDFFSLLFGESNMDGVPDPSLDWDGFLSNIERLVQSESLQWNPIKKRMKPWVSIKKLNRCYRPSTCVIM